MFFHYEILKSDVLTQKAAVVRLIQRHTGKRTAAVGDGGNDVSMIQASDAGIGIVGKVS